MKIYLNKGYIISGTALMSLLLEDNPSERSKIIDIIKPQEVEMKTKQELPNLINYIDESNDNDEDKLSIIKESINNLIK